MSDAKPTLRKPVMIPEDNPWASRWKLAAAVGAIGALMVGYGATMDPERFAFSWLFAFAAVMTMALGCIFVVLIQHLTSSGWSVTIRRTAEFYARGIWILPLLFIPIAGNVSTLYPWWDVASEHGHGDHGVAHAQAGEHAEHAAQDEHRGHDDGGHAAEAEHGAHGGHHGPEHAAHAAILEKKLGFLDAGTFWGARQVVYFLVFFWLGLWTLGLSSRQDKSGDMQLTVQMQRKATYGTFLYALSLTFAGFDWIMSLEPNWFSTMFGVRVFATGAVLGWAITILTAMSLKANGVIGNQVNTEHFHDLGKLMFGFLVFWAYISFSEFFLIWYASIPEETIYFHRRWDHDTWRTISVCIVVFKFIVPFYLAMSRNVKRNAKGLVLAAAWIVGMHFVEMYYWVMPYAADNQDLQTSGIGFILDLGSVMCAVGIYLAFVWWGMTKHSVIAVNDPRIERALNFVNA